MADTTRTYIIDAKISADALAAVRAMQQQMKGLEDAAKASASGVKNLGDTLGASGDKGARFLQSLKDQIATLGFSSRELQSFKAAQLGVTEAAEPLIATLDAETKALERQQAVLADAAASDAAAARLQASRSDQGATLVASLFAQVQAFGRSTDELLRYKAAALGVLEPIEALIAELARLRTAQAEVDAENAKQESTNRQAAAAAQERVDAGNRIIANLKEEIAVLGLNAEARLRRDAAQTGVTEQVDPLIAQLKQRQAVQAQIDDATAESVRRENEATAAELDHSRAGQTLIDSIKQRIIALQSLGISEEESIRQQAAQTGRSTEAEPLIAQLQAAKVAHAAVADAIAEESRRLDEAADAEKRYSDAGQALLANLRERVVTEGLTPTQNIQRQATDLNVLPQANDLIAQLDQRKTAAAAAADAEAELARRDNELADASRSAYDAGQLLLSQTQAQIDAITRTEVERNREKAALGNVTQEYERLNAVLEDAKAKQAKEADATREATRAHNEAQNALRNRESAQAAFIRSLNDEIATQGKSRQEILAYRAAQLQITAEAAPLINQIQGIEKAGHGASGSLGVNAGLGREIIVLGHEMSQGNFTRFGGSLLVLAEYGNVAGKAMAFLATGVGLASTVVGAAFVLIAAAAIKGAHEQEQFRKSLTLTGDFAGVTAGSFNDLAGSISKSSNITVGSSKSILQALVSTGEYGPQSIGSVGAAIGTLSKLSGKSADEIVKDFQGITTNTIEWATKSNQQYHFLDIAVFSHIKQLQDQGKTEEAASLASDELNKKLKDREEQVGALVRLYRGLANVISDVVDAAKNLGKTATPEQGLQAINAELAAIAEFNKQAEQRSKDLRSENPIIRNAAQQGGGITPPPGGASQARVEQLQAQAQALFRIVEITRDNATAQAEFNQAQDKGIAGMQTVQGIVSHLGIGDKAITELRNFNRGLEAALKARNDLLSKGKEALPLSSSLEEINAGRALPDEATADKLRQDIQKKYGDKEAQRTENAYQRYLRQLKEETAALQDEIKQYDEYGVSVNTAAEAKAKFLLSDKSSSNYLGKTSQAQQDTIIAAAQERDHAQQVKNAEQALSDLHKRVDLIKEEGEAQSANTREEQFAAEAGKVSRTIELSGDAKLIASKNQQLELLRKYIDLRADNKLFRELRDESNAIDEQIAKLDTENSLLGLSTIERTKAVEALKLEAAARKQIIANPEQADVINDTTADNVRKITEALQRNYEEQRKFEVGAKEAFQAYGEAAGNAAAFSKKVVDDGLKSLEDALFTFLKTGKLSLTSFLQQMADDFLRQTARMTIKSLLDEDSVKAGLERILGYIKDRFFPTIIADKQGTGILTPDNAASLDSFRASEISQQNAASFVGPANPSTLGATSTASELNAAATTMATSLTNTTAALTAFSADGLGTASTGFLTFISDALAPTTLSMQGLANIGVASLQGSFTTTTGSAFRLATALDFAASKAGGGGIGGLFGSGGAGAGAASTFIDYGAYLAEGGVVGSRGAIALPAYYEDGGIATRYGMLKPHPYDGGGVSAANSPKLAVFGEGRKPEAYIPLEDGINVPVTIRYEGGRKRAYVPLPNGRSIPVSVTDKGVGGGIRHYEYGGTSNVSDSMLRFYSSGGVSSGDSYDVTGPHSTQPSERLRASSGPPNVFFTVENHADATVRQQNVEQKPNGDLAVRFIVEQAVAEVDRRIASGGSTAQALRARGVNTSSNLARRF